MPRSILEKMRDERQRELSGYKDVLDKIALPEKVKEALLTERKTILILELPFKTDTVCVNAGLAQELNVKFDATEDGFSKKDWVYAKSKEDQWERTSFFKRLHKAGVLPLMCQVDDVSCEVPIEDFDHPDVLRLLKIRIEGSSMKESMKKKTLSQLHNLINHIGEDPFRAWDKGSSAPKEHTIDILALSEYFEYLEERCFSSDAKEALQELIEIKLVFYSGLPNRILNKTQLRDVSFEKRYKKGQEVQHEQHCAFFMAEKASRKKNGYVKKRIVIDLPQSFIDLLKTALKQDDLLVLKNERQLYKKTQSSRWQFTPSLLKVAKRKIAHEKGYLEEKLPGR